MTDSRPDMQCFDVTELIKEAYRHAGYDIQNLNTQHMKTAQRSVNLILDR